MNLDTLKDIVKVAKEGGVAELKVDSKDFKVSVSFVTTAAAPVVSSFGPSCSSSSSNGWSNCELKSSSCLRTFDQVSIRGHFLRFPFTR